MEAAEEREEAEPVVVIFDLEHLVLGAKAHVDVSAVEERHMPRPGHAEIDRVDLLGGDDFVDSAKVGQIMPGQRLKLLRVQEVVEDSGETSVRAAIALSGEDVELPAVAPEPQRPSMTRKSTDELMEQLKTLREAEGDADAPLFSEPVEQRISRAQTRKMLDSVAACPYD